MTVHKKAFMKLNNENNLIVVIYYARHALSYDNIGVRIIYFGVLFGNLR